MLDRAGRGGADAPVGYDLIIDIIAGPDLASFFARLNPNGRLVAVGAMAGDPPADFGLTMFAAFQKSMSFATFSANAEIVTEPERLAVTTELFRAASRGELHPMVHKVMPMEQAVAAHHEMEAGTVFGRIVLTCS